MPNLNLAQIHKNLQKIHKTKQTTFHNFFSAGASFTMN